MPGGQLFAGRQIRDAKGPLFDERAARADREHSTWKLSRSHLVVEPGFRVTDGVFEPIDHL